MLMMMSLLQSHLQQLRCPHACPCKREALKKTVVGALSLSIIYVDHFYNKL